jgi:hypothetical protein
MQASKYQLKQIGDEVMSELIATGKRGFVKNDGSRNAPPIARRL